MTYTKLQLARVIVNLADKLSPGQGLAEDVGEVIMWARFNQFSEDPELSEEPAEPVVGEPVVEETP
jgi:hypothetical protein